MNKHLFKSLFLMAVMALWGTGAWADNVFTILYGTLENGAVTPQTDFTTEDGTIFTLETPSADGNGDNCTNAMPIEGTVLYSNVSFEKKFQTPATKGTVHFEANYTTTTNGQETWKIVDSQGIEIFGTTDAGFSNGNATKEWGFCNGVSLGNCWFRQARKTHNRVVLDINLASKSVSYTVLVSSGNNSYTTLTGTYNLPESVSDVAGLTATKQTYFSYMDAVALYNVYDDATTEYGYTISYQLNGNTIKEETGAGEESAQITAQSSITVDGQKYFITDNSTKTFTISATNPNNFIVSVRKAETWTYTVKAVNQESTELKVLSTPTVVEGETANYAYPQFIAIDGQLYQSNKQNDNPWWGGSFTPEANNLAVSVLYSIVEGKNNIVFCSEAEDIDGLEIINNGNTAIRASNKAGAYATQDTKITTLQAGKYIISGACYGNAGTTFTLKAGNNTVFTVATAGNPTLTNGEEFTINEETDIIMSQAGNGGNSAKTLDYIYIQKTGDVEEEAGWRDIKVTLADADKWQSLVANGATVYITVAEDGTIGTTEDASKAAATLTGKWHGTAYGWSNFTASVPVTGCVKITYATHDYGNDIVVTDDKGEQVAKFNTKGNKWSSNHDNVVVAYYRTNEPTTLHFSKADYNPYFAVEAIAEADLPAEVTTYNVTFAAGDAEEGVAPAAIEVNAGDKFSAPKNYTLYKKYYTLTGWNDGTTTYAVGTEITPEADMTLTAVFSENNITSEDFAKDVTISFLLNGNNGQYKFEGNKGIIVTQANFNGKSVDVKADVDATAGKFAYNNSGWHQVNSGTKVIVPSCKGAKFTVSTYNDAASVTFGGAAGVVDENTATFETASEDETLVINQVADNYWNTLTIIQPAVSDEPAAEYVYRDFEIDPLGDLLTAAEQQQGAELSFGVVVNEDGTQTRVAANNAGANVVLSGTYHNNHGWRNFKAVVPVPGSVKITMSTCSWGSDVTVKDANGKSVATFTTQKGEGGSGCYGGQKGNDPNIVSAKYNGGATTLTISGGGYVNYFAIEKIEDSEEPVSKDITGTWDFGDANVMNATMALSGSQELGQVKDVEDNGLMMTVFANGATFRNNGNNIQVRSGAEFRIPVRNAGDLVTVKGYTGYSYYTIGNNNTELNDENTYTAKRSDAEVGYVAVTSVNDNNYYYSISVVQYAPKEKTTLDNEMATITFPFHEGTEGQTATFSTPDYFLNSKVTYGSNLTLKDKRTLTDAETQTAVDQTRFEPATKLNTPDEASAVRFSFTPKPGFTFKPTKVSLNVSRYGTDNGLADVTWEVANSNNVVLATEVKPNRNDRNPNISKLSYDVENAPATEGTQTLLLHLYSLQEEKQFGLSDIKIEGILNGTEMDVPILASFKVNGTEYAAEDVFGDAYEATLELPKTQQMVSATNPLTDVTPASGEVGQLTYDEKNNACTVTIPMTAGETLMNYVLNVVFKPDFTLEYIGVDGSVLTTQTVEKDAAIGEFAYDIANVPATKNGYKARGWFKTAVLGEKYTTADIITANTKLYAIQTEIEVPSTSKKYTFDLADKFFYPEDHEAFNPAGDGFYYHDAQHGWAFKNGNTVDLLVGPKATITVTLCQYGTGTGIVVKKGGETLATLDGKSDGDGGTAVYNYEGEPGSLTLEMQCSGEMYIHAMKIVNTSEVNFESQGNWYFVKAGNAGSLLDVLDVVNGQNANRDAERSFIFLPDGTYDLDATVKTAITGHNISIIGQSMDKTIIVTKPDISVEGLGKADLFDASGTNLYMQDLTLQNALDYYNAGSAGRAAVLQDAGNRTIGKNVRMLSYQDTYYSSNSSQQAYWETCDIHGTVDFICGGGDIRFQKTTLSLEPRKANGTGGRTIVAPTTNTQFGYIFDGCTVVDLANGQGDWNFGRTWQNEPICVYLNTTLDNNAKNTLVSSRWTQKGMNNKDPKLFGEYGTVDANGSNITPISNIIKSYGGDFQTILTADQAAAFAYDNMFTDWDPAMLARQLDAPAATYANGTVTWVPANNGAIAYALFKNDVFVGLTEGFTFQVEAGEDDVLTIRSANSCGGLGAPAVVTSVSTSISEVATESADSDAPAYNTAGQRVDRTFHGIVIKNGRKVVNK